MKRARMSLPRLVASSVGLLLLLAFLPDVHSSHCSGAVLPDQKKKRRRRRKSENDDLIPHGGGMVCVGKGSGGDAQ